ncbi:response regulator [Thaumasiovibrio sp. DFM-14]|uniref:response regulator n=1 Tax=Thaumasiovibrio sp. DFM-14 TaxID=3384792 RepID=UPI0039A2F86A
MRVLICDDSPVVRKRLVSYLPDTWTLVQAQHGVEALSHLCEPSTQFDLLLLDLTMPLMDGFTLLSILRDKSISIKTIVISADVQEQARQRCFELGVIDFLAKPFSAEDISRVLAKYIQLDRYRLSSDRSWVDYRLQLQEICNIALGQSAALIAKQLDEFIYMPVPVVDHITSGAVMMLKEDIRYNADVLAVSQRFVGGGLQGEALVTMHGIDSQTLTAKLCHKDYSASDEENLVDLASVLISTLLFSLSQQIGIEFSARPPMMLKKTRLTYSDGCEISDKQHDQYLSIEFTYTSENSDFKCDVLLLMSPESSMKWKTLLEYSQ